MRISPGSAGASCHFIQANASSGGSVFRSSRTPPSMLRPQRFSSMLKGLLRVVGTAIPCFAA